MLTNNCFNGLQNIVSFRLNDVQYSALLKMANFNDSNLSDYIRYLLDEEYVKYNNVFNE